MILILLACAGPAGSDTSAADTSATDTGATDTGATAADSWPCGPYAPQAMLFGQPGAVNYRSVYDFDAEPFGTGTFTFEGLGTADLDGTEVWIHRDSGDTVDTGGTHHEWTATTSYVCDEKGLQQAHVDETQTLTFASGERVSSTGERVFSVRPVVYPPGLGVGTVWDFHAVYTESHSDGTTAEREEIVTRSAEAEEEVTVPAGTFDALHIVMTNEETGSVADLWTARVTGTVRTGDMVLVSHETFE